MKLNKILVSGGNGFLGSHLCKHLGRKGIGIISEKNTTNTVREIDVTNLSRLLTIRDQVEAIVHLAAKTSITNSLRSPHDTYYTNVVGTLNLLEFARQKKVNNFINVSTYVYGQPRYLPIDEKHPVDPQSPYNASKVAAEQLCQSYSNSFEMNIVTLRPFYLYGPSSRPNSFIGCILEQMKNKKGKVVLSGELTRRDFLYVDDFVNLIETILENFPTGYGIYNVGSGQSYSLTEVSLILAKLLGKTISINYDNKMRPGDITDMVADISKISIAFGWKPETSLEEGLIRALQLNYK